MPIMSEEDVKLITDALRLLKGLEKKLKEMIGQE